MNTAVPLSLALALSFPHSLALENLSLALASYLCTTLNNGSKQLQRAGATRTEHGSSRENRLFSRVLVHNLENTFWIFQWNSNPSLHNTLIHLATQHTYTYTHSQTHTYTYTKHTHTIYTLGTVIHLVINGDFVAFRNVSDREYPHHSLS